jgi:hypothetical protein
MQWPAGGCQCFAGTDPAFDKHGNSTECDKNGNGGTWANEVYSIKEHHHYHSEIIKNSDDTLPEDHEEYDENENTPGYGYNKLDDDDEEEENDEDEDEVEEDEFKATEFIGRNLQSSRSQNERGSKSGKGNRDSSESGRGKRGDRSGRGKKD